MTQDSQDSVLRTRDSVYVAGGSQGFDLAGEPDHTRTARSAGGGVGCCVRASEVYLEATVSSASAPLAARPTTSDESRIGVLLDLSRFFFMKIDRRKWVSSFVELLSPNLQ